MWLQPRLSWKPSTFLAQRHGLSSATSRQLQPWGGRGRGRWGEGTVSPSSHCDAAMVSLLPSGCCRRSQCRRGSCWGVASAWELQAGHSRVRLDFDSHGICHAHLLVMFR